MNKPKIILQAATIVVLTTAVFHAVFTYVIGSTDPRQWSLFHRLSETIIYFLMWAIIIHQTKFK